MYIPPEYPKLRSLDLIPVIMDDKQFFLLRDAQGIVEKQLIVSPDVAFVLILCNGKNSILDIQTQYVKKFGQLLFSDKFKMLLQQLDENLFLESDTFREYKRRLEEEFKKADKREAHFSGSVYPADSKELEKYISSFFDSAKDKTKTDFAEDNLCGLVVPHIDYIRGGRTYASGYLSFYNTISSRANNSVLPSTYFIFGTCHAPSKKSFVLTKKDFETPFGIVRTNKSIVDKISKNFDEDFFSEELLHKFEHSIEFQVIFLKYIFDYIGKREQKPAEEMTIVPILCSIPENDGVSSSSLINNHAINEFLNFVQKVFEEIKDEAFIISGADLTHIGGIFGDKFFLNEQLLEQIRVEDLKTIELINSGLVQDFVQDVESTNKRRRICGLSSIYAAIKVSSAQKGALINYDMAHTKETNSVVTFASIALLR